MNIVQIIINREDFNKLEQFLDYKFGEGEGVKVQSKNALKDSRLEFGAHLTYDRVEVTAVKSPVDSIQVIFKYDPILLEDQNFMNRLRIILPNLYKQMSKDVVNSY